MNLASGLSTLLLLALDEAVGVETMVLVEVHIEQAQLVLEGNHGVSLLNDLLKQLVPVYPLQLALNQHSGRVIEIWSLQHQVEASVGQKFLRISNQHLGSSLGTDFHVILKFLSEITNRVLVGENIHIGAIGYCVSPLGILRL